MHIYIEKEDKNLRVKRVFAVLSSIILLTAFAWVVASKADKAQANSLQRESELTGITLLQGNTLMPVSNPFVPIKTRKLSVVVTAYSSTTWQTDDTPFITASGEWVRDGIVANNLLPFGTRITLPEIFGDKSFIVEDRMNKRKGDFHVDIWFPAYEQAKNFGSKLTYIEVQEN